MRALSTKAQEREAAAQLREEERRRAAFPRRTALLDALDWAMFAAKGGRYLSLEQARDELLLIGDEIGAAYDEDVRHKFGLPPAGVLAGVETVMAAVPN